MRSSDRWTRGVRVFANVRAISPTAESEVGGRRHCACIYRRRIMTIARAISGAVYTQLVTTTSMLAKLAVGAILLAPSAYGNGEWASSGFPSFKQQ